MSSINGTSSFYSSALLTDQIKRNEGLLADLDERLLFFKDDSSLTYARMVIDYYPYWRDDLPTDVTDSRIWDSLVRRNKQEQAQRAIRQGIISELQAMTGVDQQGQDAAGLDLFYRELSKEGSVIYLYESMNAGKTFFASLGLDLFYTRQYEEDNSRDQHSTPNRTDVLASNLQSLDGTTYVNNTSDLLQWLKSNPEDKVFLFDEASLYANSFSGEQYDVYNTLLPLTIVCRYYNARIIYIGHSGNDLGRQLRKLATPVQKQSKKRATFYDSIDDQGNPAGEKFSIYATPEMIQGAEKAGLVPDTSDKGSWKWEDGDIEKIDDEISGFDVTDHVKDPDDRIYINPPDWWSSVDSLKPIDDDDVDSSKGRGEDDKDAEDGENIDYPKDVITKEDKAVYLYEVKDGWTQEEIADVLDVSRRTVINYLK